MSRYSFGNADEAIIREVEMEKEKSEADSQSTEVTPTVLDNMDGDRNFSPEVNMNAVPGPISLDLQPELDSINLHAVSEPAISQAPVLPKQSVVLRPIIAIPSPSPSLNSEPSTLPPDSLQLNGPVVTHHNPLPPLSIPLQPSIGMPLVPPASPVRDKNMPAIIHRTTSELSRGDWEDSPRETSGLEKTSGVLGEVSMAREGEDATMKSLEFASDHTLKSPEQELISDHTLKSPEQEFTSDHTLKSPEQEFTSDHTLKSPEQDLASDNTVRNSSQDDSGNALEEKEGRSLPEEAAYMPSASTLTSILQSNRHINSRLDPIAASVDRLSLKAEYLPKGPSSRREPQKESEDLKSGSQAQQDEVTPDSQVLSFDFGSKPRRPRATLNERFARFGRRSEKKADIPIVVMADEPMQSAAETHVEETKAGEASVGEKEEIPVSQEAAPASEEKSYAPYTQEFVFSGPSEEMKSGVFTDGSQAKEYPGAKETAVEPDLFVETSPSGEFDKSQQPYEEPQQPYDESQPYEEPQQPYDESQPYESQPYEEPQQPYGESQQPYDESQQPYEEPQQPQIAHPEQEELMRQQMISGVFTDSPLRDRPFEQEKGGETPVLSDDPSQTFETDAGKTKEDWYSQEPGKSGDISQEAPYASDETAKHAESPVDTPSPQEPLREDLPQNSPPVEAPTPSEDKPLPEEERAPEPLQPLQTSERRMRDLDELQRGAGVVLPASVTRYLSQEEVKYTESELRREVLSAEHRGKEKGKQLVATIQVAMESLQAEKEALAAHVAELESQMETVEAVRNRGTGRFEEGG